MLRRLQELNPEADTATDDQILFLVINTSAVTVIPVTIFVYRAQMGAADPTDVFIPMLIATFCSTMVGLVVTAAVQRLKLWDPIVLAYLGPLALIPFLVEKEDQEVQWHAKHGLVLTGAAIVLSLIVGVISSATATASAKAMPSVTVRCRLPSWLA